MPLPARARALITATVTLGLGALAIAAVESASAPIALLAAFAAGAVLTEFLQVREDESSFDPADAYAFTFSSGVHLATVVVLGPWPAALIAAFGVVVVDQLRGLPLRKVLFNSSVFALAALAGGGAFMLLGGSPGAFDLPGDLGAFGALALIYALVNTTLVNTIVGFAASTSPWPILRESLRAEASSRVAEAGLGATLAFFVLSNPWKLVALAPLVLAVYHAHARLALLRRETARALETFANVVDERDASTYHHSARVAGHVQRLGEALGLPPATVARLRWAGRLHDLGKISVDAAVLRKPTRLDADEWAAIERHPRLSARLLRRFRLAADEARAVEYHHERFDGLGYYGIDPQRIPLASHFLIVADSYDAMTSDRPYRRGLPQAEALAQIEANAGTQFHPAVARAFVALQRDRDPREALEPYELAQLRGLFQPTAQRPLLRGYFEWRPDLVAGAGIVGALAAIAFERPELAPLGVLLAAAGYARHALDLVRSRRLARGLSAAAGAALGPEGAFVALTSRLAEASSMRWAGLLAWSEQDLDGSIELEWSCDAAGPAVSALTSWFIREAEADEELLIASGEELGREGVHVAVPLRAEGHLRAFLVLGLAHSLPRSLELALRTCAGDLALGLVRAEGDAGRHLRSVAAV